MHTVDAAAHVVENEATWDNLEGPDRRFRPVPSFDFASLRLS